MQRLPRSWLLAGSAFCCALALAGLGHSYRVERHARAAQREAVRRGVVETVPVLGSLTNKQRRTRVRLLVRGVERQASVFAGGRAYTAGTTADVAYLPARPERVFVVGARPWTWWAAMRRLFVVVAVAAGALAAARLAVAVRGRPARS